MARKGILLTAFGGPDSLDAVGPFMRNLMGQEPSSPALESALQRYMAIGGASPLPAIAERVAAALERSVNGLPPVSPGGRPDQVRARERVEVPVLVGMRYSSPSIGQAVASLSDWGVKKVVWLSLSPFDSEVSTGAYHAAVIESAAARGVEVIEADPYNRSRPFVHLLASSCMKALSELAGTERPMAVMTAHSLPLTDSGTRTYVEQLTGTAALVAAEAGLGSVDLGGLTAVFGERAFGGPGGRMPWLLAYQSKGKRGGKWLGPDIEDVIANAAETGRGGIAVCPIGFATDHLETLYDLDIAVADLVLANDMAFARARVPNDDPLMIEALQQAVQPHL